ncbi:hypothetical protein BDR04DRAFT_1170864, partial [Suillus decipiens]
EVDSDEEEFIYPGTEETKPSHRLNVNDPILSFILKSMHTFFSNSPKLNISLTDDGQDDRSIDSMIDEKFATQTNILPVIKLGEHTHPVVHLIFQGLIGDRVFYSLKNLTDALTLTLEPVQNVLSPNLPPSGSWDITQGPDTPPQLLKLKPKASALVSFLTPRKSKAAPSKVPSEPTTPPRSGGKSVAANPFAPHYQRTQDIVVEPFVAPIPQSGPWTSTQLSKWSADEDDAFGAGSQWGGHAAA